MLEEHHDRHFARPVLLLAVLQKSDHSVRISALAWHDIEIDVRIITYLIGQINRRHIPRKNCKSPNLGNTFFTASVSLVFAWLIWSSVYSICFHFSCNLNRILWSKPIWILSINLRLCVCLQVVLVVILGEAGLDQPLVEDEVKSTLDLFVGALVLLFSRRVEASDFDVALLASHQLRETTRLVASTDRLRCGHTRHSTSKMQSSTSLTLPESVNISSPLDKQFENRGQTCCQVWWRQYQWSGPCRWSL